MVLFIAILIPGSDNADWSISVDYALNCIRKNAVGSKAQAAGSTRARAAGSATAMH